MNQTKTQAQGLNYKIVLGMVAVLLAVGGLVSGVKVDSANASTPKLVAGAHASWSAEHAAIKDSGLTEDAPTF